MVAAKAIDQIHKIIERYIEVLRTNNIATDKVFVFGSYASGRIHKDSDIDLAIVSSSLSGDRYDDRCRLMHLRWDIDLRIEPHPFLPEDFEPGNPEAAEIMRTGVRIV